MLTFYYHPLSPISRRVWLALLEKEIDFNPVVIDLPNKEHLQPEFLALNPFHHVPVIQEGDFRLIESLAILDYLELTYPQPALMPLLPDAIATTKITNRRQINLFQELLFACGILFTATLASTIVTQAGVANMLLQYMLLTEPFILLLGIIAIPLTGKRLEQFKTWIIGFGLSNLGLALVQSVLMPIGLYPRRGGTLQDNIAGVFASGSGKIGRASCRERV